MEFLRLKLNVFIISWFKALSLKGKVLYCLLILIQIHLVTIWLSLSLFSLPPTSLRSLRRPWSLETNRATISSFNCSITPGSTNIWYSSHVTIVSAVFACIVYVSLDMMAILVPMSTIGPWSHRQISIRRDKSVEYTQIVWILYNLVTFRIWKNCRWVLKDYLQVAAQLRFWQGIDEIFDVE